MMTLNLTPPPNPSADAIQSAYTLLAIAADPKGARSRLDELVGAHENIKAAHAALELERKRLIDENARADDLREKENLLAEKEASLQQAGRAHSIAASALQERERRCASLEEAVAKRAADLAAAEQKLADKAAAFREAISA
jgi:hypothetical protein